MPIVEVYVPPEENPDHIGDPVALSTFRPDLPFEKTRIRAGEPDTMSGLNYASVGCSAVGVTSYGSD